jgi:hypothetical protein
MSWTTILLIGWPVASLVCGPLIGRFVGVRKDDPADPPDAVAPPLPEAKVKPAGFAKSAHQPLTN